MLSNQERSVFLHGVFLEIYGQGVLLKGESGVGKSETALALVDRGHTLIADDVVVFKRAPCGEKISGQCPEKLQDLLEVRGLGILNMRHLSGESIFKQEATLDLILHFVPIPLSTLRGISPSYSEEKLLELSVPKIKLAIHSYRNTALLVETAVKYHQSSRSKVA